ncbi:SlyX family protein [Tropicimonas sp. S265A]|uniref:SlyX family protein n=1 Tax=Tropicimonas sp. S265A TaxID=3415134 RepID=UPI003C7D99F9
MADQALEERIAHLEKTVDELSAMLAARGVEIDQLQARVTRLMAREAERDAEGTGGVILGDERPPHY